MLKHAETIDTNKVYKLGIFSTKPCIFATFRAKSSAHLQAVRRETSQTSRK